MQGGQLWLRKLTLGFEFSNFNIKKTNLLAFENNLYFKVRNLMCLGDAGWGRGEMSETAAVRSNHCFVIGISLCEFLPPSEPQFSPL